MNKRIIFSLFFLTIFCTELFAFTTEIKNSDGVSIYYEISSYGEAHVSFRSDLKHQYYNSYANEYFDEVNIPDSIFYEGKYYPVTSIRESAFRNCVNLKSVTIPKSITSIGNYAFAGCTSLSFISIPDNVINLGSYVFYKCSNLSSAKLGDGLKTINEGTFMDCSSLRSLTIGNGIMSIYDRVFWYCSSLTSVTIPKCLTYIGTEVFSGCSSLVSVNISDLSAWCSISFFKKERNPLYYAHHLYLNGQEVKDLNIPDGVTSIGNYTFYGCSGLISVTIPNSVTSIGKNAFEDCI